MPPFCRRVRLRPREAAGCVKSAAVELDGLWRDRGARQRRLACSLCRVLAVGPLAPVLPSVKGGDTCAGWVRQYHLIARPCLLSVCRQTRGESLSPKRFHSPVCTQFLKGGLGGSLCVPGDNRLLQGQLKVPMSASPFISSSPSWSLRALDIQPPL